MDESTVDTDSGRPAIGNLLWRIETIWTVRATDVILQRLLGVVAARLYQFRLFPVVVAVDTSAMSSTS